MKKNEYMAPEMEIVKIEYNKILMASGDTVDNPPSEPGEPGDY